MEPLRTRHAVWEKIRRDMGVLIVSRTKLQKQNPPCCTCRKRKPGEGMVGCDKADYGIVKAAEAE